MRLHTARRSALPRALPRLLGSLLLIGAAGVSTACAAPTASAAGSEAAVLAPRPLGQLVPVPASVRPGGSPYSLNDGTRIRVDGSSGEARKIGEYLAGVLRPSTGYALPVTAKDGADGIRLRLGSGDSKLGAEGYTLTSGRGSVTITARKPAGLFHGVQTLRQLLPARIESDSRQKGPWSVAGGSVTDAPRYGYRGAMLDVSRHFFSVTEVKRYIDQLALYKINTFHLHLSDDQGWRIAIDSWPKLATYGGSTEVGGGTGGYYTKSQYKEIVNYAASRYLEVVPEIDMPSHTNAALASYAELNCDGVAPPLYTGIEVGFSSLCAGKDVTYDFIDDVLGEVAALTPGRYLHIGGDEAHSTSHEDYAKIMNRAQAIVGKYGKTVMGWHQITGATPVKGAVAQYWGYDKTSAADRQQVVDAAKNGTRLVMSAGRPGVPGHEVQRPDRTGPEVGRSGRGPALLRLGPGDVSDRRPGGGGAGRRGADLGGDPDGQRRHRRDGVPAAARGGGAGLVPGGDARLGHVQAAAGGARAAVHGDGDRLLPVAAGAVAAWSRLRRGDLRSRAAVRRWRRCPPPPDG